MKKLEKINGESFGNFKISVLFASLLKRSVQAFSSSWFRASALQAEGRRFESVNAPHKKRHFRLSKGRLAQLVQASALQAEVGVSNRQCPIMSKSLL